MGDLSDAAKQVYTVESISDQREKNGRTEYFIKWKGWSARFSTWEPTDNILDPKLIDDFNKRRSGKLNKSQLRLVSHEPPDAVHASDSDSISILSKPDSAAGKRRLSHVDNTQTQNGYQKNADKTKKLKKSDASSVTMDGHLPVSEEAVRSAAHANLPTSTSNVEVATSTSLATSSKTSAAPEQSVQKASAAIKQLDKSTLRKVQLPYPFDEMKDDDDGIHPDAVQYFVIPRSDGSTFRVRMCKNKSLLLRTRKRAR